MNCPNCGAPAAPGILYCTNCHAAINGTEPSGQQWLQKPQALQPSYQQGFQPGAAPRQSWQQSSPAAAVNGFPELSPAGQLGGFGQGAQNSYAPQTQQTGFDPASVPNTFAPQVQQGTFEPAGSFAPQQQGGYAPQGAQNTFAPQTQQGGYAPQGVQNTFAPQQQAGYAPQGAQNSYAPQTQQGGYPQQNAYPQQYGQGYGYQTRQEPNPATALLSELPQLFLGSLKNPGQVLRTLVERADVITGPIVLAVTLVVVFLGGMAAMRGVVGVLFSLIGSLTGISLAGSTAALRQGVNYIAGQIAPAVGGIAVLCQLIAIVVPALVVLGYLNLVHKLPLNWLMALEMVTVTTMPTIVVALAAMLASMINPALALLVMILGTVIAYLQLSHMLGTLLGGTDVQQLKVKMICFPLAILLTLGLIWLVGGNLMGNVFQHMISLLGNMGTMV